MSKLTDEQRQQIKAADKPQTQLAKEFGVSAVTIAKIKSTGQPKPAPSSIELTVEEDWVTLRLPKKALTKKLLADLL
ncbi:MAG TPA: hypothetical protein VE954_37960 [Oligoflexus sp.]|uniref:hypothetical protein n=1 Tax=Oligoflexus sp. TaxID=1971216 RepID=UPI002D2F39EF|nr:hypothetical protein [Oligoflexus sp.]HYX38927.1 hypothetical protein [Oligoflexus sp.]